MLTFSPVDAESLIEQHRQELASFLFRRVSCQETANDLLQDLFLRLVSVKSVEPIHNPPRVPVSDRRQPRHRLFAPPTN